MENTSEVEPEPWQQFKDTIQQYYSADAMWVSRGSLAGLALAYTALIAAGIVGNLLVLTAILRRREMRIARNVYIANLAVSDLCLCAVTMPLTFMEVVYQRWQWGDSPLICHLQAPLQAVFVIISSLSISAIATDRYLAICCPPQHSLSLRTCLYSLPLIWSLGLALCSPLAVYRSLLSTGESLALTSFSFSSMVELFSSKPGTDQVTLAAMQRLADSTFRSNMTGLYMQLEEEESPLVEVQSSVAALVETILDAMAFPEGLIVRHAECIEVWPVHWVEQVYTWLVTTSQFLLPLIVAGLANAAIYRVLKERLASYSARTSGKNRLVEIQKMKRTSKLLVCLVALFLICWLPLALFNLAQEQIRQVSSDNIFFTAFAICHLFGMTSACLNPVLYGFLNESYKKEFKEMWAVLCRSRSRARREQGMEMEKPAANLVDVD